MTSPHPIPPATLASLIDSWEEHAQRLEEKARTKHSYPFLIDTARAVALRGAARELRQLLAEKRYAA